MIFLSDGSLNFFSGLESVMSASQAVKLVKLQGIKPDIGGHWVINYHGGAGWESVSLLTLKVMLKNNGHDVSRSLDVARLDHGRVFMVGGAGFKFVLEGVK